MRCVASGFEALEAPTVADDGALLFSDLRAGGVHRLDRDGRVEVVVAGRKAIGGICLHADGGLVLSGADLRHVDGANQRVLLELADVAPKPGTRAVGFNDIAADREGRLFAGVLRQDEAGEPVPGALLWVLGEREHVVVHDAVHANGLGLSPDGARLYLSDTFGRRVLVFGLSPGQPPVAIDAISTAHAPGLPDGLAVDAAGCIWVAFYRGGCVARFAPDGRIMRRVPVPALKPLSVCIAGDAPPRLYVVSARRAPGSAETGRVFCMDVDVPAVAPDRARV